VVDANGAAVAVVGTGYWGRNLVRVFAQLGALVAICDRDRAAVEAQAALYPGVQVAPWEGILDDPGIRAVVLATPAAQHYPQAVAALAAGKDVFVEKPLALHVTEGRELVALAEERAAVLMVGHILEYHPAVTRLHQLVRDGELGAIRYVYSNRLNLGKVRQEENILWSFAPHDISVIVRLLGLEPTAVSAFGGSYLQADIADVTVTNLMFPSAARAHVFVSWLHPYKEQRLVVVGERQMAVFDDTVAEGKLKVYDKGIDWQAGQPVPRQAAAVVVPVEPTEPLRLECAHFLACVRERRPPLTDGASGLRVLAVLEAGQRSLARGGAPVALAEVAGEGEGRGSAPQELGLFSGTAVGEPPAAAPFQAHPSAVIDPPCEIGAGTRIWHFSHVMPGARIGRGCNIGQNVFIGSGVTVGDGVKIQNNVSLYDGVVVEDDVFLGPSMVFTNVLNPRSHVPRRDAYRATRVRRGASIGANATVLCGLTIGRYAFVGAGAVVTRDVPDHGLVYGNPARLHGWMCRCGEKLPLARTDDPERATCGRCHERYAKEGRTVHRLEGEET
jgi:UDP-2-acetamido-3-amino-2,3-dideoxy-glucuronate N-acetyltransferase